MRPRVLTDLSRQKCVSKTLKYTKYSCGFTPFSDENSLVRLSCRFVRYCPKNPVLRPNKIPTAVDRSTAVGIAALYVGLDGTDGLDCRKDFLPILDAACLNAAGQVHAPGRKLRDGL